MFSNFESLNDNLSVAVKNVLFPIIGKGEVKLRFGQRVFTLTNVMLSDQFRRNLISGPQLDLCGLSFHGGRNDMNICRGDEFLFKISLKNIIYRFFLKIPKSGSHSVKFEALTTNRIDLMMQWHRRCDHINQSILAHTSRKQGVRGILGFK